MFGGAKSAVGLAIAVAISKCPKVDVYYISREALGEIFRRRCFWSPSVSFAHHSATVARDLGFFLCGDNLNFVCQEANEFETVDS
jgi:hypothetical protein